MWGCLWLSLFRPSQAVPKKGNRKNSNRGLMAMPWRDQTSSQHAPKKHKFPPHPSTLLSHHALKICPGVATSKWNERPAAQMVSGLRGILFFFWSMGIRASSLAASCIFLNLHWATNRKETTAFCCRQNTWSDGEVVVEVPDSKASNLGDTSNNLRCRIGCTQNANKLLYPIHGAAKADTARLNLQYRKGP